MASTSAANSETSQWYINTADNSTAFDPSYAVFGQVVSGMDVVNKIAALGIDPNAINVFGFTGGLPGVPLLNTSLPPSLSNLVVTDTVTVKSTHTAYENPTNRLAVLAGATVTAADATAVISDLVKNGIYTVGTQPLTTTFQYVDTNGDGLVDPLDALQVINFLNDPTPGSAAVPAGLSVPSVSSTASFRSQRPTRCSPPPRWCSSAGGSDAAFAAVPQSEPKRYLAAGWLIFHARPPSAYALAFDRHVIHNQTHAAPPTRSHVSTPCDGSDDPRDSTRDETDAIRFSW